MAAGAGQGAATRLRRRSGGRRSGLGPGSQQAGSDGAASAVPEAVVELARRCAARPPHAPAALGWLGQGIMPSARKQPKVSTRARAEVPARGRA